MYLRGNKLVELTRSPLFCFRVCSWLLCYRDDEELYKQEFWLCVNKRSRTISVTQEDKRKSIKH
jgi:hypothetical protein